MAKGGYIGINNTARKIKKGYIGVPTQKDALKFLEYIESTGTQYIDTGWKFGTVNYPNVSLEADVAITATSGTRITGVGSYTSFYYGVGVIGSGWACGNGYGDVNVSNSSYTIGTRVKINYSLQTPLFTVKDQSNGNIIANSSFTPQTPQHSAVPFLLSAFKQSNTGAITPHAERIYSFKIFENENLVRDFVPCQNASGEIGMYDKVHDVFYPNAGTGTFIAGSVIEEVGGETVEVARKIKKAYMGVGGVAKLIWSGISGFKYLIRYASTTNNQYIDQDVQIQNMAVPYQWQTDSFTVPVENTLLEAISVQRDSSSPYNILLTFYNENGYNTGFDLDIKGEYQAYLFAAIENDNITVCNSLSTDYVHSNIYNFQMSNNRESITLVSQFNGTDIKVYPLTQFSALTEYGCFLYKGYLYAATDSAFVKYNIFSNTISASYAISTPYARGYPLAVLADRNRVLYFYGAKGGNWDLYLLDLDDMALIATQTLTVDNNMQRIYFINEENDYLYFSHQGYSSGQGNFIYKVSKDLTVVEKICEWFINPSTSNAQQPMYVSNDFVVVQQRISSGNYQIQKLELDGTLIAVSSNNINLTITEGTIIKEA